MEIYQHDNVASFRFVVRGELFGARVQELEHAWTTARSILNGKELVIDVSGLTRTDVLGEDLLFRMRAAGARVTAAAPRKSEGFLRSLSGLIDALREFERHIVRNLQARP